VGTYEPVSATIESKMLVSFPQNADWDRLSVSPGGERPRVECYSDGGRLERSAADAAGLILAVLSGAQRPINSAPIPR